MCGGWPANRSSACGAEVEIQTHGLERRGRRVKGWPSLPHIVEPCLFWMAWSRSKIRLVHKKDGSVSLPSKRFCASLSSDHGTSDLIGQRAKRYARVSQRPM